MPACRQFSVHRYLQKSLRRADSFVEHPFRSQSRRLLTGALVVCTGLLRAPCHDLCAANLQYKPKQPRTLLTPTLCPCADHFPDAYAGQNTCVWRLNPHIGSVSMLVPTPHASSLAVWQQDPRHPQQPHFAFAPKLADFGRPALVSRQPPAHRPFATPCSPPVRRVRAQLPDRGHCRRVGSAAFLSNPQPCLHRFCRPCSRPHRSRSADEVKFDVRLMSVCSPAKPLAPTPLLPWSPAHLLRARAFAGSAFRMRACRACAEYPQVEPPSAPSP